MSDAGTLPQGGAETAAPEPQPIEIHDERSAADALLQSGLLDSLGDAAPEAPEDSGQEPDTGPAETPATGTEEDGQPEPQAPAAIDAPVSWSAEEKAVFATLPPDAQKVIASRESERDRVVTQRTQEAAEQRKAAEASLQAVNTERAQYTQNLQVLAALVAPELAQYQQIDMARLAAENPAQYVQLDAQKKALEARIGAIQQQFAAVQQRQAAEQQQNIGQLLARERQAAVEKMPEFGDPVKAPKLVKDISDTALSYGFTPDEVGRLVDHRLLLMARDAMLYRQGQTARATAQAKVATPAPPRVQQPGTPAQPGDARTRQIREVIGRFNQTGSERDAAKLLEFIL